jgi:hypothetical protein
MAVFLDDEPYSDDGPPAKRRLRLVVEPFHEFDDTDGPGIYAWPDEAVLAQWEAEADAKFHQHEP